MAFYQNGKAFTNQVHTSIGQYKVSADVRNQLLNILQKYDAAVERVGEFERQNPDLCGVSTGLQVCPHCGSNLNRVGWKTCPHCNNAIGWGYTRELKYAGFRTKGGQTWTRTEAGPCLPDQVPLQNELYGLWADVVDLRREFLVLKQSKEKDSCFVATATFCDIDHPTVQYLRQFRDHSLAKSNCGRMFIQWYYKNGESLSNLVWAFPVFRPALKLVLNITSFLLKCFVYNPTNKSADTFVDAGPENLL